MLWHLWVRVRVLPSIPSKKSRWQVFLGMHVHCHGYFCAVRREPGTPLGRGRATPRRYAQQSQRRWRLLLQRDGDGGVHTTLSVLLAHAHAPSQSPSRASTSRCDATENDCLLPPDSPPLSLLKPSFRSSRSPHLCSRCVRRLRSRGRRGRSSVGRARGRASRRRD